MILWAAAVLHDIGMAVDYDDHHKHTRYLILSGGLPGFSPREVALIAQMTANIVAMANETLFGLRCSDWRSWPIDSPVAARSTLCGSTQRRRLDRHWGPRPIPNTSRCLARGWSPGGRATWFWTGSRPWICSWKAATS